MRFKMVFVLSLLLFIFMPLGSVFAEKVETEIPHNFKKGLLDDTFLKNHINSTLKNVMYDNDDSTYINFTGNSYLIFDIPVNLTGMYLKADTVHPTVKEYNLIFIFDNGKSYTKKFTGKHDGYLSLNLTNVVRIDIQMADTKFYEVDFFGSYDNGEFNAISDLKFTKTYNSILLNWNNPISNDFNGVIIKKNGEQVADLSSDRTNYTVRGLEPDTEYNIEVIAKYSDGEMSEPVKETIRTEKEPEDTTPPDNIKSLNYTVKSTIVSMAYTLPSDEDFSHLEVYRDDKLIRDQHKEDSLFDENLVPNTTYTYRFVSVDLTGNKSNGFVQTITTDPEIDNVPPLPPVNLNVTNGNKSLRLTWNKNTEPDLKGYNIYMNGNKINDTLVYSAYYVISNLENGESYNIQVSAVDTSDNESILSEIISGIPSEDAMPILETKYELKDVASGVAEWFSNFWLILAFSVSIPLAFYISTRVKALFLS